MAGTEKKPGSGYAPVVLWCVCGRACQQCSNERKDLIDEGNEGTTGRGKERQPETKQRDKPRTSQTTTTRKRKRRPAWQQH